MNIEESIQQIETLIEAWQLDEADLNQTDINAMQTLLKENKQLKDNWDIIKQEILKIRQSTFSKYNSNEWNNCLSFNDDIEPILNKMQELEQGSDSNE